ncbi:MAG: endogenous inhibitor of DNA gyrase (YacG/DUF329 family) [Bermanella sp.]|jgi:endogenous inhibitor of DNA gyrase (YacG/DUF329 family)
MKVNCPTCSKSVEWNEDAKFRPFCSDRCRLIDLGQWANEEHAIPGKSVEEELLSEQLKDLNNDSFH